ncbi:MAG: GNAT family N-acetyltransferase [Rhodomicrobium sp.]|nr:GNAT family N-acetyltransferase [Rhodomicrobium sp.]
MVGVAQVSIDATGCYLEKLFVAPERMGQGIGRSLFLWSLESAKNLGAKELIVEADPDAAPFYKRMGCERAGSAPSGSIPGRRLPRLVHNLSPDRVPDP